MSRSPADPQGPNRGTNLPRVADFNEGVVLNAIRRTPGGRSRVELTAETGLSAQTVSNITRRLLDQGLLLESGKQPVAFGKPRTMLELDPTGGYAIGVHIDPAVITYVLLDFTGAIVAHVSHPTPPVNEPDAVLAMISTHVLTLIEGSGVDRSRILGVGIASPGPVDVERGLVLDPPHLPGWHQVPLRDHLREATGLPIVMDKDVIAGSVAEQWAASRDGEQTFVFLYLGTGVGMGFVIDDVVIRGVSSNAGDVGLLPVSDEEFGDRYDGRFRTFWQAASPHPLVSEAVDAGVLTGPVDVGSPVDVIAAFTALCRRADAGDAAAGAILDRSARHTASAILSMANMLDIGTVVVGGTMWESVAGRFLRVIQPLVSAHAVARHVHPVTVRGTTLGSDVAAIGAACLVFDDRYAPRAARLQLGD